MAVTREREAVERLYKADRVEVATPYASSKGRTVRPLFGAKGTIRAHFNSYRVDSLFLTAGVLTHTANYGYAPRPRLNLGSDRCRHPGTVAT